VVSKKPLHLRRAQLLKHLLLPLLQSIATHTSVLLRCPVGSKVVLETILESYRQLHPQSSSQQKEYSHNKRKQRTIGLIKRSSTVPVERHQLDPSHQTPVAAQEQINRDRH